MQCERCAASIGSNCTLWRRLFLDFLRFFSFFFFLLDRLSSSTGEMLLRLLRDLFGVGGLVGWLEASSLECLEKSESSRWCGEDERRGEVDSDGVLCLPLCCFFLLTGGEGESGLFGEGDCDGEPLSSSSPEEYDCFNCDEGEVDVLL